MKLFKQSFLVINIILLLAGCHKSEQSNDSSLPAVGSNTKKEQQAPSIEVKNLKFSASQLDLSNPSCIAVGKDGKIVKLKDKALTAIPEGVFVTGDCYTTQTETTK